MKKQNVELNGVYWYQGKSGSWPVLVQLIALENSVGSVKDVHPDFTFKSDIRNADQHLEKWESSGDKKSHKPNANRGEVYNDIHIKHLTKLLPETIKPSIKTNFKN